jgi:rRNA maturation endonuclease Nob1
MWGFITIGSIVICVLLFSKAIKTVVKFSGEKEDNKNIKIFNMYDEVGTDEDLEKKEAFTANTRENYLGVYMQAFKSLNIQSLSSILTDLQYHMVSNKINSLIKRGLRQEIIIQEKTKSGRDTSGRDFMKYGGINSIIDYVQAQYIERLFDNTNGNVLYEKNIPDANVQLILCKSNVKKIAEDKYCTGCGTKLNTNGELFICPNCGATYKSDSFDWVINRIKVEDKKNSTITKISQFISIGMLAAIFIGFMFGKNPVVAIMLAIINISIIALGFWYKNFVNYSYKAIYQLAEIDPNMSVIKLDSRVNYLTEIIYNGMNNNINDLKTFMDPLEFESLQENHSNKDEYFVDFKPMFAVLSNLIEKDNRHYLTATLYLAKVTTVNAKKEVKTSYKKISFDIYRYSHVRYQTKTEMEGFCCKNCDMPINLTATGTCKYCGTEYDLAEFDWKIGKIHNI